MGAGGVGWCNHTAASLEQFLQHVVLRVGLLYPPLQGSTPEECKGAVRSTSDGRYISSPNFSWGECGESLNKSLFLFFKQVFLSWQIVTPRCMGSVQPSCTMSESGILPCLSCLKGSQSQQPL